MIILEKLKLGTGRLGWRGTERRCDRYGTIAFMNDEAIPRHTALGKPISTNKEKIKIPRYNGFGKLIAIVKKTREPIHIGDFFHGFSPEMPKVGEIIELGEGTIFYDTDEFGDMVGLIPKDGRMTFWLNPPALYRCHNQTVELIFEKDKDVN